MSPALEFVVSSELERFIASHEFLKPGDKLEGKIIEIKKNGKALINFGKFRAVANIKFPFKAGETLPVTVDSKGPKLTLRLDNRQLQVSPEARQMISKIDIFPEKTSGKIQAEIQKVMDANAANEDRQLPEIIRETLARISTFFEPLETTADSAVQADRTQALLKLVTQLQNHIRKSGIFFEKDLETAINKLMGKSGQNLKAKELVRLPEIRDILANDLKPNLLVLRAYLDRAVPLRLAEGADPLQMQMQNLKQLVDDILNNINNQQNSAVEKQTAQQPLPDREAVQVFHFTLPLKESEKNAKLKVYYSKKQKGKEKGKKGTRLSLLLEMERLGDIRTDFYLVQKNLNITFFVKNHQVREKIQSHVPEVKENLEDWFDYLVLKVIVSERKITEFDTEDLDIQVVTRRMVDVKV